MVVPHGHIPGGLGDPLWCRILRFRELAGPAGGGGRVGATRAKTGYLSEALAAMLTWGIRRAAGLCSK